jgi:hypothetical protein
LLARNVDWSFIDIKVALVGAALAGLLGEA